MVNVLDEGCRTDESARSCGTVYSGEDFDDSLPEEIFEKYDKSFLARLKAPLIFEAFDGPHTLIGRYLYRIFDNIVFFGIIESVMPVTQHDLRRSREDKCMQPHVHVVYNDGDHQQICLSEVRLCLCNNNAVPPDVKDSCLSHVSNRTYLHREPLPPV